MRRRYRLLSNAQEARAALLVLLLIGSAPVLGQNDARISGGTTSGVTTINVAAGNNNQQVNGGAIASGDTALSNIGASQHLDDSSGNSGGASTHLDANAFAGSSGWIAVNGASGNDNQQANLAAFAFGTNVGAAGDALLNQTRASQGPTGGVAANPTDPQRSVAVGDGAFAGSQGLIQLSLIGGDRNTSANTFALSVSGQARP